MPLSDLYLGQNPEPPEAVNEAEEQCAKCFGYFDADAMHVKETREQKNGVVILTKTYLCNDCVTRCNGRTTWGGKECGAIVLRDSPLCLDCDIRQTCEALKRAEDVDEIEELTEELGRLVRERAAVLAMKEAA